MGRTHDRPVASRRVSVGAAAMFGLALSALSVVVFAVSTNWLATLLAVGGNVFYVAVYTGWLKPLTPQNIVIGGAAGAVPPLVGWAAVAGSLGAPALWLFAIVFFWTPPTSGRWRYSSGTTTRPPGSRCCPSFGTSARPFGGSSATPPSFQSSPCCRSDGPRSGRPTAFLPSRWTSGSWFSHGDCSASPHAAAPERSSMPRWCISAGCSWQSPWLPSSEDELPRRSRRRSATPPTCWCLRRSARPGCRPAPAQPGSGTSTARPASAPAPAGRGSRCPRTARRPPREARPSRRWHAPGPLDRDPPSPKGHRAVLVAVADRGPVRVVLALGAAQRDHRLLHQRLQHLQPGAHGQRQQALPATAPPSRWRCRAPARRQAGPASRTLWPQRRAVHRRRRVPAPPGAG